MLKLYHSQIALSLTKKTFKQRGFIASYPSGHISAHATAIRLQN
jgi:hypothetical protein